VVSLVEAKTTMPTDTTGSAQRSRSAVSPGWGRPDVAWLLGLAAAGVLLASRLNFATHPLEDAAMLMRYALNLAHGHGMVWNVGENHVDGATDFLFTVVLAVPIRAGVTPVVAVRAVVLLAEALTVLLVYLVARKIQDAGPVTAGVAAAFILLGPGLRLAEACFGAPFFGLTVALSWIAAWWYRASPTHRSRSGAFAAACVVMSLVRPEGVLLAGFMLVALVVDLGLRRSRLVLGASLVACLVGAAYFAWRWNYFGYPLPNPYYKKGGGVLHLDGLRTSVHYAIQFGWPFLLVAAFALSHRATRRLAIFTLIPFVGFTVVWFLVSDEVNYLGRFQYPLLVLGAISFAPLWCAIWRGGIGAHARRRNVRIDPLIALTVGLLVVAGVSTRLDAFQRDALFTQDGRYDEGRALAPFASKGYTLVTTEAGLLPLISGWRTIDAWGLNDPSVVHQGLTVAYLNENHPDVIVVHSTYSPVDPRPSVEWLPGWNAMTKKLDSYADSHGFVRAASFGGFHETWNFYVLAHLPDACEIIDRIRAVHFVPLMSTRPLPDQISTPTAPSGTELPCVLGF
jgi:hypothetical protein